MKCPNCNESISKGDLFCPTCGTKVNEIKEEANTVERVVLREVPRKKSSIGTIFLTSLITILLCIGGAYLAYKYYFEDKITFSSTPTNIDNSNTLVTIEDSGIAEAVSKVYDSVVVIKNYQNGSLYATGTGFVYKVDGNKAYILTNAHVLEKGTSYTVTFTDDSKVDAKLVGSDTYSDIAVLQVDAKSVKMVAITGKAEDLRLGDTVFAVGAPVDSDIYGWSVTRGVLSGKDRLVSVNETSTTAGYIAQVLQTDAAINSGNSGGPLCNSNGEVIGITNMKLSSSQIEGIGFAIPIETATKYADMMIKGEEIDRPFLGLAMYDANSTSAWSFFGRGTTTVDGIIVNAVEEGSPAEKAGFKKGDQIISIGGKEVKDVLHFKYELYKYGVGDTVKIEIKRDGVTKTLEVKLKSSKEV